MASAAPTNNQARDLNQQKWGKANLDAGFTIIPNVIFERQRELGLDSLDLAIIIHIIGRWWSPKSKPFPAKAAIALALGVHSRTIQKRIAAMERKGLVHRQERRIPGERSLTNMYNLAGLAAAAEPYSIEKLRGRIERQRASDAAALRNSSLPIGS